MTTEPGAGQLMTEPDAGRPTTRPAGIRLRITLLAMVAVGVVLAVTGVLLVRIQERQLLADVDRSLTLRADELAVLVHPDGEGPVALPGTGADGPVQLVTEEGRVVTATSGLELAEPIAPAPRGHSAITTVDALPIEDDVYRILSRRIEGGREPLILHVAHDLDDLNDGVRSLALSLAVAFPLVVAALGAVVWWLVGRTLRPIEAIRREVAAIGATELDHRVGRPGTGDEVDRLAGTMNDMLDRLERASTRQQRFVADASHELRSPLTRLRARVELARRDGGPEVLDEVLDEATELDRLVDELLWLARSDAGRAPQRRQPLDLDDVVLREVEGFRAAGHRLDLGGLSAAHVVGDGPALARAVRNLLDNAVRHAGTTVTVQLGEVDDRARLVIADDGPGIPPEDRERIFERFTRLDDARSRAHGGTGLGLAIAREIIDGHGGRLELEDAEPGARFVVLLPLAPDDAMA
jgi:signal transduction histidine kinase